METTFFFFSNKTIIRNYKIVISDRGMKGWELVSQRTTWVDPYHQKRSHAWVGAVVHYITQNQYRYFVQISIFWAKWGEWPPAVSSLGGIWAAFWYRTGGGAAGEAPCTLALPAGHRGTGPPGTCSHTGARIPQSHRVVRAGPRAFGEHQTSWPDLSYLSREENEWRKSHSWHLPGFHERLAEPTSLLSLLLHFSSQTSQFSLLLWQTPMKPAAAIKAHLEPSHKSGVSRPPGAGTFQRCIMNRRIVSTF